MNPEIKCCPNCGRDLDPLSKECPHCLTKIGRNLENFLISRVKLFTLIGIFGALSIYLLNISQNGNNAGILQIGSSFSILIVIILSIVCVFDLVRYIKIEEPDYKEFPVSIFLQNMKNLPAIILFLVFFVGLISILTFYVLSDEKISKALAFTLFIIGFSLFLIFVYYIYRYSIEFVMNRVTEKLTGKFSDSKIQMINLIILGVLSFGLILSLIQIIFNQVTGVLPLDVGDISFSSIMLIIFLTLLMDCLLLMHKKLKLISTSPKKYQILAPSMIPDNEHNKLIEIDLNSDDNNPVNQDILESEKITKGTSEGEINHPLNVDPSAQKSKFEMVKKSVRRILISLIAIIVFLSLALWYESYLFPNDSKNLIIGIIGGVISGIVIILYQKGIEKSE